MTETEARLCPAPRYPVLDLGEYMQRLALATTEGDLA